MFKPRKWWALLLIPVFALGLVAIATSDDADAGTAHTFTVPTAAFHTINEDSEFANQGFNLTNDSTIAYGFIADLSFLSDSVTITDLTLHYYDNGAETLRIVVLKRAAGYSQQNVHVFVDGSGGPREVALKDISGDG